MTCFHWAVNQFTISQMFWKLRTETNTKNTDRGHSRSPHQTACTSYTRMLIFFCKYRPVNVYGNIKQNTSSTAPLHSSLQEGLYSFIRAWLKTITETSAPFPSYSQHVASALEKIEKGGETDPVPSKTKNVSHIRQVRVTQVYKWKL